MALANLARYLKRLPLLFVVLLAVFPNETSAQILKPVKWDISKASLDNPGEYVIVFKATIDDGWKIYANDIADGGPVRTDIFLDKNGGVEPVEGVEQLGRVHGPKYDEFFDMDLKWYESRAVFRQKVKVTADEATVGGYLEFMTCDATQCLPPTEVPFSFKLKGTGEWQGMTQPTTEDTSTTEGGQTFVIEGENQNTGGTTNDDDRYFDQDVYNAKSLLSGFKEMEKDNSLWGFLLAGFGSGLLALLTPCVFPMIPLTVSFFTKGTKDRKKGLMNALTYALSIVVIFLGLGFIITYAAGPSALNAMASSNIFNVAFFVIFIIFAISFFGAFEITLPSKFVNRVDSMSDRGGLIGIFFMAFTLVLVSFSCTAPIVGTMLVLIADSSQFWAPLMGLLGFSLALAIPFALFAAFPGWLSSLPKSGSWLNTVKVCLGFIELALAFKFLSVADLAYHWGFLTRDIFLAIWIICAILLGVYLIGKLRFKGEPVLESVSIPRLFFGVLALAFAVYMIPGMWGAPVKLLSGIAPPSHYQEFTLNPIQYKIRQLEEKVDEVALAVNVDKKKQVEEQAYLIPEEVINVGECPHELPCFFDLDRGMAEAKRTGKPVLVDFTGWSCVNCRKMEDMVWSDPGIWELINDKYILVSLYVDDKSQLPEEFQTSRFTVNKVRTVGQLWADLQRKWFDINAQPYYVLMDHDYKPLVKPVGYTPSIPKYERYLKSGLNRFEEEPIAQN